MTRISVEQLDDIFERLWAGLQSDFFKLETLQKYAMDTEDEVYKAFKAGDTEKVNKLFRDMLSSETDDTNSSVKSSRIHIVTLPLSEYLMFEIESYKVSEELGESIYLVEQSAAMAALNNIGVPIKDFLMFDEKAVILHTFDDEGNLQYSELIGDQEEVSKYIQVRRVLEGISVPFREFLKSL